jgi:hypothetical protein
VLGFLSQFFDIFLTSKIFNQNSKSRLWSAARGVQLAKVQGDTFFWPSIIPNENCGNPWNVDFCWQMPHTWSRLTHVAVAYFLDTLSPMVARFFLVQYTKTGENIQNDHTMTKCPKGRPKWSQIGIIGMKIYHLATLLSPRETIFSKMDWNCANSYFKNLRPEQLERN